MHPRVGRTADPNAEGADDKRAADPSGQKAGIKRASVWVGALELLLELHTATLSPIRFVLGKLNFFRKDYRCSTVHQVIILF